MPPLNDKDTAPRVAISIAGLNTASDIPVEFAFETAPPGEVLYCKSWSMDFDLLQLGDPFSVEIDNADGRHTGKVRCFDEVGVYVSDSRVSRGWTKLYDGIVTNVTARSTRDGDTITINGADRGWLLSNCHAIPWKSVEAGTWDVLISRIVDPTWGFQSPSIGNDVKRHVSQGRAGAVRYLTQRAVPPLQPFQTEIGQSPVDVILHYAKIAKCLVNVYGRKIQIFHPVYTAPASYSIELHKSTDARRNDGNIISAELTQSADGIYTEVRCYSSVVAPPVESQSDRVHAGEYRGTVSHPENIQQGIRRLFAFSDPEQMDKTNCVKRAEWKNQRGKFDSWTYTATVYGISQGGLYFAPDTMIAVNDTVNNVVGTYYMTAVAMHCDLRGGVTTHLTIKPKDLLGG